VKNAPPLAKHDWGEEPAETKLRIDDGVSTGVVKVGDEALLPTLGVALRRLTASKFR